MRRSSTLVVMATLCVAMLGTTPFGGGAVAPSAIPGISAPGDVEGQGWQSALACLGCVAGAVAIIGSGSGAILTAMAVNGSTLVAAGCIGMCYDAVRE